MKMINRNLKFYPDSILRNRSAEIKDFNTKELDDLIITMTEVMSNNLGVGLAAPQIGILERVIVYKTIEDDETIEYLINPEIIEKKDTRVCEEGCLSIPEVTGNVKRAKYIKVKGFDRDGNEIIRKTDKFWGIIIQHELDHLNGKLFIDYLSPMKRRMALSKYNKNIRQNM